MKKEIKLVLTVMLMLAYMAAFSADNSFAVATKKAAKATVTKATKKTSARKASARKTLARKASVKKTSAKRKRLSRKTNSRSASSRALSNSSNVELLDWWTSASKVFGRGDTATIYDIKSGRSFEVVRTMGTNHADVEARTAEDTAIIKSIWDGFSWDTRPIYVIVDGRRLAASMSAMPHAGVDAKPAYAEVENRSGGFGSGMNLDVIKGNDMNGHMDIHFLNSTRHKDGKSDPRHQASVLEAAGR